MLEHDWLSNALTMWGRILQVDPTIATRVALPESFLVSALSLIIFELNRPTSFPPFALPTLLSTCYFSRYAMPLPPNFFSSLSLEEQTPDRAIVVAVDFVRPFSRIIARCSLLIYLGHYIFWVSMGADSSGIAAHSSVSLWAVLSILKPDVQDTIKQWPIGGSEGLEGKTSDKVPT